MGYSYTKVIQISSNGSSWQDMPTPVELKPIWETLDSENTGRDNNTGKMFRDKVADKGKWEIDFPAGLSNTQVSTMLQIMKAGSYYVKIPDSLTGMYKQFQVYTSSCEPEIERITELTNNVPNKWVYKAFSIHIIEM